MSCKHTQRFNAEARASQRFVAPQVDYIHPKRVADAEEFGFDACDVFAFARIMGTDFTSALLMMDEQRAATSK